MTTGGGFAHRLLRAGAAVDVQDDEGKTALMEAARGGHLEIVRALLQAGANINLRDKNEETAFTLTARGGRLDVVKLLLKSGADINHQNKYGETALMHATENDQFETAAGGAAAQR